MNALDLNHETSIRLEDLTALYNFAARRAKTLDSLKLDKKFFLTAGLAIVAPERRQPHNSAAEMTALNDECADMLKKIVKILTTKKGWAKPKPLPEWEAAEKERRKITTSKSAKAKAKRRVLTQEEELQKFGISIKTACSIDRKAEADYKSPQEGPDYSRIMDYVRVTLFVKDVKSIIALSNYFRPCNNPQTVHFENSFACKNDETGMRRLMVNYRLPNGCIVEIQVQHEGAQKAYQRSHDAFRIERAIPEAKNRSYDSATQKRLGLIEGQAHKERTATNESINQELGLNSVVLDRTFYSVNGFPVMKVYNPWTTNTFTVVPNPISGFYEVDRRFLRMLEDPGQFKADIQPSKRDDFIRLSVALSHSEQAKSMIVENSL